jgi:hypothetical protein
VVTSCFTPDVSGLCVELLLPGEDLSPELLEGGDQPLPDVPGLCVELLLPGEDLSPELLEGGDQLLYLLSLVSMWSSCCLGRT